MGTTQRGGADATKGLAGEAAMREAEIRPTRRASANSSGKYLLTFLMFLGVWANRAPGTSRTSSRGCIPEGCRLGQVALAALDRQHPAFFQHPPAARRAFGIPPFHAARPVLVPASAVASEPMNQLLFMFSLRSALAASHVASARCDRREGFRSFLRKILARLDATHTIPEAVCCDSSISASSAL